MPKQSLSATFVQSATCPEGKSRIDYYDTSITGFILEVRHSGGKTYYLRYRDDHNKQRQYKIGDATALTFDKARKQAQMLRSKVVLGEDPSAQRHKRRQIPTLAEFSEVHYMPFVKSYKKSWDSDDSYLRNHLLPKFGGLHLDQISQQAVMALQRDMKARGYADATCNRMVVLLRYMFNLAKKWRIPGAEHNPTHGAKLFEVNNARERFLTQPETQRLYQAIAGSRNTQLKYIVPLLLLLGCRKSELFKARWEDVNLERRSWRIPISKNGKTRHVPLSKAALEIFNALPRFEGCAYVVPNPKTLKPFHSVYHSWDTARKLAGLPDVRMHDLRHSMASNLVNSGRSIYEVSQILGHTQIKTSQRYAHLSQETLLDAADAAAKASGSAY